MAITDKSKVNIAENSGSTTMPASTSTQNGEAPKNIWAGMTRDDAVKYNLLDQFNKANTNPDETLTQEEYDAHINQQSEPKDITSKSGTRVASGGIYTVKKGDTLSKIAKDFGIDTYQLYLLNKKEIGSNINIIQVGQKIKITKDAEEQPKTSATSVSTDSENTTTEGNNNKKIKPLILSDNAKKALSEALGIDVTNMTPEELAEKTVSMDIGKLAQCFQIVMKNSTNDDLKNLMEALTQNDTLSTTIISAAKNLDTPEKIQELMDKLSNAIGEDVSKLSLKDLMAKTQSLDKATKTVIVKEVLIKTLGDSEAVHTAFKDYEGEITQEDFDNFYGITDEIRNEQDVSKKLDLIAEAMGKKIVEDMDLNNPDSYLNTTLADIKNGHLTEYEQKTYGSDVSKLDEKTILQIAQQRVRNAHTNIFASAMTEDIINDNLKEFQFKLELYVKEAVQSAFGEGTEDNGVLAALGSTVANYEDTPEEFKESISNTIGSHSKELGVDNLDDDFFRAVSTTIYTYGSEETLNTYSNNNSNRADILTDVINNVMGNTTNQERANILNNALNTVNSIQQNNGSSSGNTSSIPSSVPTNNGINPQQVNYASNPISNTQTSEIAAMKEASAELYGGQNTGMSADMIKQKELEELEALRSEMMAKMRIKMAELRNKPLGEALSEIITHYNEMPSNIRDRFINHMTQFASSHKDMACKAYITGTDELKQFFKKQNIITKADVFEYFDNNENEIKFAPKVLQIEYYKYKSYEMMQQG